MWKTETIGEVRMATISFKCPNCGGDLVFDPSTGKYKCEFCLSLFTQAELEQLEADRAEDTVVQQKDPAAACSDETGYSQGNGSGSADSKNESGSANSTDGYAQNNGSCNHDRETVLGTGSGDGFKDENTNNAKDAVLYTCPSCGAEIVTDQTTSSLFCFYCHNPVVLSGKLEGGFKPDKVIPFAFGREDAQQRFLDFVKSKKFVPNAFFNKKQIDKLAGVYFPYWVFDAKMDAGLAGEAKNVRVWVTGDTEYTETKVYQVERQGEVFLNDLTKNALKKADVQLSQGVLPYDFSKAEDFHMGYLSGFVSERRDIDRQELEKSVRQEVTNYVQTMMEGEVRGYTSFYGGPCRISNVEEDWTYVLLPVWTVTYRGSDGKTYYYSMNGQTGKTFGELPVDKKKMFLTGLLIGIIIFAVFLMGGYLL